MTHAQWMPYAPPHTAPEDTRDQRAVLLLLAASDPFGLVADGHRVERYGSTAHAVLEQLRGGGGVDELFGLFVTAGTRLEAVDAFTRMAVRWWTSQARTTGPPGPRAGPRTVAGWPYAWGNG